MRSPVVSLVFAVAFAIASRTAEAQSTLVIRNVRVFDGERVLDRRDVMISNGVISAVSASRLTVPRGATVVDGTGRTLLPGLIDSHVHLSDSVAADLRQALSLGVTTVLDMWNGGPRYEVIKTLRSADSPDMAAVRTAGIGATVPGGHPTQMGGPPFPTISDSADADAFVSARIAEGSDYIKIIFDDLAGLGRPLPMMDQRTLIGLISAAHKHGNRAVVHVGTEAQARTAVEAGADGLAHLFAAASVGSDFADVVARHGAFVVPTLTIMYGLCGRPSGAAVIGDSLLRPFVRPQYRSRMTIPWKQTAPSCDGTDEAIRAMAARGVPLLAGTDSPAPGATYGASLHGELELLVRAGLTPTQALVAATSAPAHAFGLDDRGRVKPGLRADLLLVDGDPTSDILRTRRIVRVWKRGVEMKRLRDEG
jgi:imidazolonepropionase-like amidohydrolase